MPELTSPWDPLIPADSDGKDFERLCKWWLQSAPQYSSQVGNVWLWDEWPGRDGPDIGIDLVAELHNGDLWAIQAKAYSPTNTVTLADVDKWLSASATPKFAYRLIIATTDLMSVNARKKIASQEKSAGCVMRSDLLSSGVSWPASLDGLKPERPQPFDPRPHQKSAIHDVVKGLKDESRGQLIMPCGTGKTLVASWVAQELGAKRTIVFVPSLSLLRQTLVEWSRQASSNVTFLAVCSDSTVTSGSDELVGSTSEIGQEATTDPVEISAFLRKRKGSSVVMATYQSSEAVAAAMSRASVPAFDFLVCDEAHRTAGAAGSEFGVPLRQEKIRARKRLFMTATPRVVTGTVRAKAEEAGVQVASMDDSSVYGDVLHSLSFRRAAEDGLLCDYQVVVAVAQESGFAEVVEKAEKVRHKDLSDTDTRTLGRQLTLLRAMRKYSLKRAISFHSYVRSAKRFSGELPQVRGWAPTSHRPEGTLWSSYVEGEMTASTRQIRIETLRTIGDDESAVLANARCLTEGIDVPAVDAVAFMDPRRSQVDIVQAVGRAMRVHEDKELGRIVVPLVVEPGETAEESLAKSEFQRVWSVLQALSAHDSVLADELNELRVQLGRKGSLAGKPSGKIVFDLPKQLGGGFAKALNVMIVEKSTESWYFWFGLLEEYRDENDHASPTGKERYHGFGLGNWVKKQRFRRAQLSDDKIEKLESVDGWVWNARGVPWDEMFSALKRYTEVHPDSAPARSAVFDSLPVGDWAFRQRKRKADLSAGQRTMLEGLSGWFWDSNEAKWKKAFACLQRYVATHGHARPKKGEKFEGFPLGDWVIRRRSKKSQLSAERRKMLEDLPGWVWNANDAQWLEGFACLQRYVATHGHARPTKGEEFDGFPVGNWVSRQRSRKAKLSAERRKMLEDLPGWVWNSGGA